jgi:hypothetical protein
MEDAMAAHHDRKPLASDRGVVLSAYFDVLWLFAHGWLRRVRIVRAIVELSACGRGPRKSPVGGLVLYEKLSLLPVQLFRGTLHEAGLSPA